MPIHALYARDWCTLDTCASSSIPQDCVVFQGIAICKPCLLELGEMTLSEEYTKLEKEIDKLFNQKDELEAMIAEHTKGVGSD